MSDIILTPEQIRANMAQTLVELRKAADAIRNLEEIAERSDLIVDSKTDIALLEATGTVDERKAKARLAVVEARDEAIIHRAALNRAKLKAKHLEQTLMTWQSMLKSIQIEGA
jgi:hypothetical protein